MGEQLTPEALEAIQARRVGPVRLRMRERLVAKADRGEWAATAAVVLGLMDEDAADIAALLAEVERLGALTKHVHDGHPCGAMSPGADGRLRVCDQRVPGPRWCPIHAKGADNA